MEKLKQNKIPFDPLYLFYALLSPLLLYILIGSWDHRVSITMEGVLRNQESGEILDTATITINGKINGKAFKNDRFQCEILLDGHESDENDIYIENAYGEIYTFGRTKAAALLDRKYNTPVNIDIWYQIDQSVLQFNYKYLPSDVYFIGSATNADEAEQALIRLLESRR